MSRLSHARDTSSGMPGDVSGGCQYQLERAIIMERVKAGLKRARAHGKKRTSARSAASS